MNATIDQFAEFSLEPNALRSIRGGLCACKAAAPYACEAGGYTVGTQGFSTCMGLVYQDCEGLLPECAEQ